MLFTIQNSKKAHRKQTQYCLMHFERLHLHWRVVRAAESNGVIVAGAASDCEALSAQVELRRETFAGSILLCKMPTKTFLTYEISIQPINIKYCFLVFSFILKIYYMFKRPSHGNVLMNHHHNQMSQHCRGRKLSMMIQSETWVWAQKTRPDCQTVDENVLLCKVDQQVVLKHLIQTDQSCLLMLEIAQAAR